MEIIYLFHYNKIMIFNTIEKQLRNFNRSSDKFQDKCPINFNQMPVKYSKPRQFILTQCKRDLQNKNIQSPTSNSDRERKILTRTLSGQKVKKNLKLDKNNKEKHKIIHSIHKKLHEVKRKNQYANLGLQNHINRFDLLRENKNREYKSPQSSNLKKQNNQLSQTGISTGSELYELSPIHFNKYMEYKDRNNKKEAFSFGQDRSNYEGGYKKLREEPNYMRFQEYVHAQRTYDIMVSHQNMPRYMHKEQLLLDKKTKYDNSTQTQKQNKNQCQQERYEQCCEKMKTNWDQLTFSKSSQKLNELKLGSGQNNEDVRPILNSSNNFWIFVSIISVLTMVIYQIIR